MKNSTENNRLIAEFMGVVPNNGGEFEMYGVIECIEDGMREKHFFFGNEMKFSTSWDWLIPAIAKFNKTAPSSLFKTKIMSEISSYALINEITFAYQKLIEGIQWYND